MQGHPGKGQVFAYMVSGGNSNGTQMEPHRGGPRCQAGEGVVFLGEQELEGLGLIGWGRCGFVFQRENLASGGWWWW